MTAVVGHGVRKRTYDGRGLPPRWVATVEFPRRADGKRNRRSKSFPTEAGAKDWVRIQIAQAAASPATAGQRADRRTVGGLLEDWYTHGTAVMDWSPTHAAGSRWIIDRHLTALARFPLHRLTVSGVDDLLAGMAADGVSPWTIRQARRTLRAAFNFAIRRQEFAGRNPAALAGVPAVHRTTPGFVHPEHLPAFLVAVERNWRAPFFLTCALMALRPSEGTGLQWHDLDAAAGALAVRRSVHRQPGLGVVVRPTKTHRERTLQLPASLLARLLAHRADLDRDGFATAGEAPMFPGVTGAPLDAKRAAKVLRDLMRDAGLPHVTLYQLRHTGATLRIAGGVTIETVRRDLGHSNINQTQQYVEVLEAARRGSADVLETLLQAARSVPTDRPGGTAGGTPAQITPLRRRAG